MQHNIEADLLQISLNDVFVGQSFFFGFKTTVLHTSLRCQYPRSLQEIIANQAPSSRRISSLVAYQILYASDDIRQSSDTLIDCLKFYLHSNSKNHHDVGNVTDANNEEVSADKDNCCWSYGYGSTSSLSDGQQTIMLSCGSLSDSSYSFSESRFNSTLDHSANQSECTSSQPSIEVPRVAATSMMATFCDIAEVDPDATVEMTGSSKACDLSGSWDKSLSNNASSKSHNTQEVASTTSALNYSIHEESISDSILLLNDGPTSSHHTSLPDKQTCTAPCDKSDTLQPNICDNDIGNQSQWPCIPESVEIEEFLCQAEQNPEETEIEISQSKISYKEESKFSQTEIAMSEDLEAFLADGSAFSQEVMHNVSNKKSDNPITDHQSSATDIQSRTVLANSLENAYSEEALVEQSSQIEIPMSEDLEVFLAEGSMFSQELDNVAEDRDDSERNNSGTDRAPANNVSHPRVQGSCDAIVFDKKSPEAVLDRQACNKVQVVAEGIIQSEEMFSQRSSHSSSSDSDSDSNLLSKRAGKVVGDIVQSEEMFSQRSSHFSSSDSDSDSNLLAKVNHTENIIQSEEMFSPQPCNKHREDSGHSDSSGNNRSDVSCPVQPQRPSEHIGPYEIVQSEDMFGPDFPEAPECSYVGNQGKSILQKLISLDCTQKAAHQENGELVDSETMFESQMPQAGLARNHNVRARRKSVRFAKTLKHMQNISAIDEQMCTTPVVLVPERCRSSILKMGDIELVQRTQYSQSYEATCDSPMSSVSVELFSPSPAVYRVNSVYQSTPCSDSQDCDVSDDEIIPQTPYISKLRYSKINHTSQQSTVNTASSYVGIEPSEKQSERVQAKFHHSSGILCDSIDNSRDLFSDSGTSNVSNHQCSSNSVDLFSDESWTECNASKNLKTPGRESLLCRKLF